MAKSDHENRFGTNPDEPVRDEEMRTNPDRHPDPITHAPGAHPVGTGVGAAAAGAAGAAIGTALGGPVGGVIGATAGAIVGGFVGKASAEAIDPTEEDAYWRQHYKNRDYVAKDEPYDTYAGAYRYGWESAERYPDRDFSDVKDDIERDYRQSAQAKQMDYERARAAIEDAFNRTCERRAQRPLVPPPLPKDDLAGSDQDAN